MKETIFLNFLQLYNTDAQCLPHIDWVKVLRPTRHKIDHFGDVFPSQSIGLVLKNENKHNKSKHSSVKNTLQHKIKPKN